MSYENINRASRGLGGLLLAAGLFLAGCTSVPHKEFGAYQSSFDSVKAGAEDVYLRAGLLAEKKADRPDAGETGSGRRKELDARKEAISARLAALDLIDHYNRVLTGLAAGTSAVEMKGQVTGLSDELSSFNLTQVNRLLQKASPLFDVVTQGAALVEDAMKKARFREAILAAQKPLIGILDILIEDSADLEGIFIAELQLEQDPYRKQCDSAASRFSRRMKGFKRADVVEIALERHNQIRRQWARPKVQMLSFQENGAAVEATPADLEALAALSDQAESNVIEYNKIQDKIVAQRAVFEQYRGALQATKRAFIALPSAVDATRLSATNSFIQQARELRKATLMLQEAI